MRARTIGPIVALVVGGLIRPSLATAQWRLGVYMGGNHSAPADIHIVQPTAGTDLTYHHVGFDAEPFKAPQDTGWRLGHGFGKRWGLGWELEFTHLKLFARTDEVVPVSGVAGGVAVTGDQAMTAHVQRYSMSHGLNFILFNLTSRLPLGPDGPHGGRVAGRRRPHVAARGDEGRRREPRAI